MTHINPKSHVNLLCQSEVLPAALTPSLHSHLSVLSHNSIKSTTVYFHCIFYFVFVLFHSPGSHAASENWSRASELHDSRKQQVELKARTQSMFRIRAYIKVRTPRGTLTYRCSHKTYHWWQKMTGLHFYTAYFYISLEILYTYGCVDVCS